MLLASAAHRREAWRAACVLRQALGLPHHVGRNPIREVLSATQVCRPCQVARIHIAVNWSPAATTVKTCHTSWNENTVGRSVGQCRAKHTAPTR